MKKSVKETAKAATDLAKVGKQGTKALVRNDKVAMKGVRKDFAKGAKTFDDLGQRLSKKLRFITQMVKDVQASKTVKWMFSSRLGTKRDVLKMVDDLLNDVSYLRKHLKPEDLDLFIANKVNIKKLIEVADFHITF